MTCGSGVQYREVDCVQGRNTTNKNRCSSGIVPESRRECNAGLCPSWDVGKRGQVGFNLIPHFQHKKISLLNFFRPWVSLLMSFRSSVSAINVLEGSS